MLTIRLQRTGKRNQADFRIVLAEKASHVSKKVVEILGSYNPHKKIFNLKNPERVNYWLAQHVELSPTVNNLLVEKGILKGSKVKAFNVPKKETLAEPSAEAAPAAEATESAAEAADAVAEAPAEAVETPAENTEAAA